ncbi:MAG: hypothetical protein IJY36_03700 [Coprobacter sp.]|nr:hypothetical protein [Coprobacter sp.]
MWDLISDFLVRTIIWIIGIILAFGFISMMIGFIKEEVIDPLRNAFRDEKKS